MSRSLSRGHRLVLATAAVLTATGAALLAGCSDGATATSGTGRVVVHLTDAPCPFDSVRGVDACVVRVDAGVADAGGAAGAAGGSWSPSRGAASTPSSGAKA